MGNAYLWLVHDDKTHQLDLSEAVVIANGLPCESMELTKRHHSFVVEQGNIEDFWRKIKTIFPCKFKVYEFSDEEMLRGEYYFDSSRNTCAYVP